MDRGSVSALSESISKSACAFPTISKAALVLASSRSARSARAVALANSRRSADAFDGRAAGARPVRAPLSRALRHSDRCEEYSPSRRSSTPRAAGSAASYSARTSSLYLAVNDRRRSEGYQSLSQLMQPVMDEIEAIGARGDLAGVPTGFAALDDLTGLVLAVDPECCSDSGDHDCC